MQTSSLEFLARTQLREACGDNSLKAVMVRRDGPVSSTYSARALLICTGAKPSPGWLCHQVLCNAKGYLLTGRDLLADHAAPQLGS